MDKFNLDIPKMGYILLVRYNRDNKNFFSERIYQQQRKFYDVEHALYTHAEILGGGADSVCICFPKSQAIKIDKRYKGRYVKILRPVQSDFPEFEEKYRYKIAYFYARLNNLAYDCKGILSFLWKFITQNNRLFFCSEGVTWAYQKIYPCFLDGQRPDKIFPSHIAATNQLEVYWEGIIQ